MNTVMSFPKNRGVAQPGSALGSGPRGREFKSPLPDHFLSALWEKKNQFGLLFRTFNEDALKWDRCMLYQPEYSTPFSCFTFS